MFDTSILVVGQTYKLCLEVFDKAGNKSETDIFVFRQGSLVLIGIISLFLIRGWL